MVFTNTSLRDIVKNVFNLPDFAIVGGPTWFASERYDIVAKAQGEAAAFDRVYVQYKAAPEVTRRRMYYETMERVLSKVDKTIVEPGVTPYLPLQGPRAAPPAVQGPAAGAAQ